MRPSPVEGPLRPRAGTKVDAGLQLLLSRKNEWVPLPELGRAMRCRCVSSTLCKLRELGWTLINRQARDLSTQENHSWYMLVIEPPASDG